MKRAILLMSLASALIGCAGSPDTVVFVTKTSLGVSVEQTPPSASIAYDRIEGYFGPRYDTGAVPPVMARIQTNGKLLDRQVKQVYATGDAARLFIDPSAAIPSEPAGHGEHRPMFFGTSTTVGAKLDFGNDGVTTGFLFGFKRKEFSAIPATDGSFPSVLATLDTDLQGSSANDAGLRVGQLFATGAAATALARHPEVGPEFMKEVTSGLTVYREQERVQSRDALVTLSCLSAVGDDQLAKVWQNADALQLMPDAKPLAFGQLSPSAARERYTRYLALLNPDSAQFALLMGLHRQYVCGLAGR